MFKRAADLAAFVVNDTPVFDYGTATIVNLDPIAPATVRYAMRGYHPSMAGVNESTFFYQRMSYAVGEEQPAAIYVEIPTTQVDTYGPAIKVIHAGNGDGIYVAQVDGNGSAYEAATWSDGTRGYISTLQIGGLPNSTLFNGFWGQADTPNFGMFYADAVQGNAFVAHKRVGAGDGITTIKVIEDITTLAGRHRFAVYNSGQVDLQSLLATAGVPLRESPELHFKSAAWDGANSDEQEIIMKVVSTGAATFELRFYQQLAGGGATLLCAITSGQLLDMQNGSLVNVASIQASANLDLYSTGALCAQLVPPPADGDTGMLLRRQLAGVETLQQVTMGAVDSGGAGFRLLRVPN